VPAPCRPPRPRASPPPPAPARAALWVTRGRQVTANGGSRLTRAGGRAGRQEARGGTFPATAHPPDCGFPAVTGLGRSSARHGQAGGGGGSRGCGGLRGRWGPGLRGGGRQEAPSDRRGRLRWLPAAQRGDAGQVSGTRAATACRVPTPGDPARGPGEAGARGPSTAPSRPSESRAPNPVPLRWDCPGRAPGSLPPSEPGAP
jgi:hypothetical protein